MGYTSWRCAKTGLSIANINSELPREYSQCYLVTPNKVYYEDAYKGFGKFDGVDIYELLGEGDRDLGLKREYHLVTGKPFDIKVVLAKHYNNEKYEDLPPSKKCPFQGYFFNEKYLKSLGI